MCAPGGCGESCGPLSHRAGRLLAEATFPTAGFRMEEEERPNHTGVRGSGTCRHDEKRGGRPARLTGRVIQAGL